jgi:hypothetical protein
LRVVIPGSRINVRPGRSESCRLCHLRRAPGIMGGTQDEGLSSRNVSGIEVSPHRAAALASIARVCQGVDTCAQDPKYTVEDPPVVNTGNATRLVRKERPGSPFKVREFASHDSRLRFGCLNHVQTDAFNRQKRTTGTSEITPEPGMTQTSQNRRERPRSGRIIHCRSRRPGS